VGRFWLPNVWAGTAAFRSSGCPLSCQIATFAVAICYIGNTATPTVASAQMAVTVRLGEQLRFWYGLRAFGSIGTKDSGPIAGAPPLDGALVRETCSWRGEFDDKDLSVS